MATLKLIIRYALCLPSDLIFTWSIIALIRAMWGTSLTWRSGVLVSELSPTSWPMRTWYKPWGGTTFGHGVMLAPNMAPSVLQHELVHVEQYEGSCALGFLLCLLLAALGWWWVGLLVWPLTHPVLYGCASLVAWLRSEPDAYMGNVMEEGARAIAGSGCDAAPPK